MSVIKKPDLKIFAQDAKTGEIETFPDVLRGWGITLDRTAGKPPLEWFNAIGQRTDEWLMYLTQRGVAEWDATLSYPKTAIVQFNSVIYVSIKETKGEQPDKSQASWSTLAEFLGLGNYYTKTDADTKFQPKGNYAPAGNYQPAGDYATNAALNNGLASKFDKAGGVVGGGVTAVALGAMRKSTNSTVYLYPAIDGQPNGFAYFQYRIGNDWFGRVEIPRPAINQVTRLMQIGDYGLGATPSSKDANTVESTEFTAADGDSVNFFATFAPALSLKRPGGADNTGFITQIQGDAKTRIAFRQRERGIWRGWYEFYSTANTKADRNGQLKLSTAPDEISDYPVGAPIPWPQATTPGGFLVCNGQWFNKTNYPLLAKAYPSGQLPDLRSEFIRGLDAGRNIDNGRVVLSAQSDENKEHSHSIILKNGNGNGGNEQASLRTLAINVSNATYTTEKSGGKESRPRNIAFLYIVRAA